MRGRRMTLPLPALDKINEAIQKRARVALKIPR
jgi:hypothetical protein